ncbi:MAG: hypothetical protein H0X64_01045 [Gemmatimonadaceae bacterium]|nr:hypothetical protein [Gemmatimonadaceae bacterium]
MVIVHSREGALGAAWYSLLYPGLGQARQGRRWAAAWYAADCTALVIGGLVYPADQWMWWTAAVLFGLHSIFDAYRHDRDARAA